MFKNSWYDSNSDKMSAVGYTAETEISCHRYGTIREVQNIEC